MKLPEFLTTLSPVGETLSSVAAGEAFLLDAVASKNAQVCVNTATDALSLWEADYGLQDRSGGDAERRRLDIRIAMAGGRTLTPAYLAELAATLGGADSAEITEDFANFRVFLNVIANNRVPEDTAALERALARLKPAHLSIEVTPVGAMTGTQPRFSTLHGGIFMEFRA